MPLFGVTAVVLYLLYAQLGDVDFASIQIDPRFIALAFVALLFNFSLAALRWRTILFAMELRVPLRRIVYAMLATWPLAVMTPSRASDFLRAFCIDAPRAEGAGSVLAEKLIDVQSLCLLAIVGGTITANYMVVVVAAALLLAEWCCIALLLTQTERFLRLPVVRRAADKLRRALLALRALRERPAAFLLVCLSSIGSWLCATGTLLSLLFALGLEPPFLLVIAAWPLATFVGLIPVTVAGMGTRDAAFVGLMGALAPSLPGTLLALAALGYSLVTTWSLALLGLPFLFHFLARFKASGD